MASALEHTNERVGLSAIAPGETFATTMTISEMEAFIEDCKAAVQTARDREDKAATDRFEKLVAEHRRA